MQTTLTRDELMGRILEAMPEAEAYLRPHHERIHQGYALLRGAFPEGGRVAVDLGAAGGMFLPALDALGFAELHAIDLGRSVESRPLSFRVAGRVIHGRHHEVDIERAALPFPSDSVDLVTFLEVIEHLAVDPMHTLLESNRVLRAGGSLLVSTPNACSAESLLRILRGTHPGHYPPLRAHPDHRHHREYAPAELRLLVECAGFQVESLLTLPPGRSSVRFLVRLLRAFGKARIPDALLGENIYLLAKKVRSIDPLRIPIAERRPEPVYHREP